MMLGHGAPDWGVVAIFVTVYLGMILGGLPRLKLDRAGVALLGAIGVIGLGEMSGAQAANAVDLPTILLLFSFMVLSAQMGMSGFYIAVTQWLVALPLRRQGLLAALIAVAAALSAVFSNDIVCPAMAPVVARLCLQRRLDPVPVLVGLACAANIGSAATLIGNPQNMLIGSVLHLPFGAYVRQALPPVLLSLAVLWAWLVWGPQARSHFLPPDVPVPGDVELRAAPAFDAWQTGKGLAVAGALLLVFLFTDWPREVAALVGAGVLLLSRRFHSSRVVGLVAWEALVSTLAGNLLLVGSIANLIVVDLAQRHGVRIDWRAHARIGIPVTLATLAIVWLWLSGMLTVG